MRYFKFLSLAVFTICFFNVTSITAKSKVVPKLYMFGFSASFNDSVVYFTDIQTIDNAYIDSKTNFLLSRDNYSYQLKSYLEEQVGLKNRTCVTVFALKQKDLEKKLVNMKRKYTTKGNFDVKYLDATKFHYERIEINTQEADSVAEVKEKKAAEMKKMNKKKIGMPAGKSPGGPGGPGGRMGEGGPSGMGGAMEGQMGEMKE